MNAPATPRERRQPTAQEFREMQTSPQFVELKKTYRNFTFPMSIAFFVWYLVYVFTATYAPDFMAQPVFGSVNVGVVFGLAQFITTFVITWIYIKYANKNIEPRAAAIREQMEG
ncbi:DUF485 domain-containing protein [Corynebacterium kozikiae]|uniref:DUF485 domain-containing protein n=1 Tax=Corynebacterium kozikiae TaxID=2968469 RepID=UPI00211C4231|nr:DUF485 domain-containing protein [Corynebacterium sp. 76QC2CO]MCQ9343938.1 DUF485 domain-containing protein [Corynebacterium sp. 76QC2CO]